MFAHHILKPELMPIEANIWGTPKSSGSFSTLYKSRILRALDYKTNPFELQLKNSKSLKISNINNPLNCNTIQLKPTLTLKRTAHQSVFPTGIPAKQILKTAQLI
jgi:hypothetical protein